MKTPAPGPPRPLLVLLGLSFVLAVFPLTYMVHYTRVWWGERAGKSLAEQRDTYPNTPWLQPMFQRFVTWVDGRLPEGAAVLVTPSQLMRLGPGGRPLNELETSGKTRWFLYLNYALYPRPVYVRQPADASGTLVDYPSWVRYHDDVLDVDGRHAGDLASVLQRAQALEEERPLLADLVARHGALYELEVPTTRAFKPAEVRLFRLDPDVPAEEGGPRVEELQVPDGATLMRQSREEESARGDG